MLIQIKFYLSDFIKCFTKSIITFLQFIVVMCLVTYILQALWGYERVKNTMEEMTEENQIYMLDDATEEYRFNQLLINESYLPKMKQLEAYAQSKSNMISYVADTSMPISLDNNIKIPKKTERNSYQNVNEMNCVRITSNFFQVFQLQGDFDEEEVSEKFADYKVEDKVIPVMLGSDFKGYMKKNDVFQNTQGVEYVVLGFLDQGSYYIAPNRGEALIELDNYLIVPCQTTYTDSTGFSFNFFSTYYVTKDKSQVTDIMKKSNELDLYSLKLSSFEKQMQNIQASIIEKVLFDSILCMIILIMSIAGLMGNLIQFIAEYMSEFAIHLLCGARESEIILRIGIQVAVLIIGANIVDFAVFGVNISSLTTLGMSVLLGGLIMIYPIVKIYSQSIMLMIRRNTI